MASEYLKKKYQDVKPEEPKVLTEKEKRENWWHYHKWYLLGAAALLAVIIWFIADVTSVVRPDYQIAYVGSKSLPESTEEAVQTALESLGGDRNGDGDVVVELKQYVFDGGMQEQLSQITIVADLSTGDCEFFLLEDPVGFQTSYSVLASAGESADQEAAPAEQCVRYLWKDCPVLAALELGTYTVALGGEVYTGEHGELLEELYLSRFHAYSEDAPEYAEAFWQAMTAGAAE